MEKLYHGAINEAIKKIKDKGADFIQRHNWKQTPAFALITILIFVIAVWSSGNQNKPIEAEPTAKVMSKSTENLLYSESAEIRENFKDEHFIETQAENESAPTYTDEELYMMSHLIGAEAGETEKSRQLVGLVVLNRMNSDDPNFPDTMEEVIFQRGQYACTWDGNYEKEPNADEIESAKKVLSGEAEYELAPEVIFQSTRALGVVHEKVWSEVMQNWTYFCSPY